MANSDLHKVKPEVAGGFRDYLPSDMLTRQRMIETIRGVFESFGFQPIETPAVEREEVLTGGDPNFGMDIFRIQRERLDDQRLAFRFDLTVPLARFVAAHPRDIVFPFRRYHLGNVWRAEKPQKGRFREFAQFDADIVGSASMLADAEVIALMHGVMTALGFSRFRIRVNNRKILNALPAFVGFPQEKIDELLRLIDKMDKLGPQFIRGSQKSIGWYWWRNNCPADLRPVYAKYLGVTVEEIEEELQKTREGRPHEIEARDRLKALGAQQLAELNWDLLRIAVQRLPDSHEDLSALSLTDDAVERLRTFLMLRGSGHEEILDDVERLVGHIPIGAEGIAELREVITYVRALGIPDECWEIDLSVARGLGYYTGPVFETYVLDAQHLGSVYSGGRFDGLVERFSPAQYPATGASVGVDRLYAIMEELELLPEPQSVTDILIMTVDQSLRHDYLGLALSLRRAGFRTEVYMGDETSFKAQLAYAAKLGIPFVVIMGPDELKRGVVQIKDMVARTQTEMPRSFIAETVSTAFRVRGRTR